MQISKQDLSPKLSRELYRSLCCVVADIRTTEEAELILKELLSETERVAIMKRLGIAVLLDKGTSYDKIRKLINVSSATIASIQERMGRPGLQNAIEKIKVNSLADAWSEKVRGLFSIFHGKK
jgi:uncharacterized protein YerC